MKHQQQQQTQQQQWTADQRRQQIAELLRNKGVICRDYLCNSRCPRTPTCPYMHIANGETRPVPWSVCTFFTQGKCLRDRCSFFHGTQAQLEELHASGSPVYRPQDYMKIAVPPPEYLNPDGSIATTLSFSAMPPTPAMQMVRAPTMSHENAVNTFQPLVLMQQSPQSIASSMFAGQGGTPNASTTQFPFYANAPLTAQMPVQAATTVFPSGMQSMQTTTYYQSTNTPMMAQPHPQQHQQQQQHYAQQHQQQQQQQQQRQQYTTQQYPNQQQQQQQQQRGPQQHQIGNQLYFQIHPQ